jgi:hypothetical protein
VTLKSSAITTMACPNCWCSSEPRTGACAGTTFSPFSENKTHSTCARTRARTHARTRPGRERQQKWAAPLKKTSPRKDGRTDDGRPNRVALARCPNEISPRVNFHLQQCNFKRPTAAAGRSSGGGQRGDRTGPRADRAEGRTPKFLMFPFLAPRMHPFMHRACMHAAARCAGSIGM